MPEIQLPQGPIRYRDNGAAGLPAVVFVHGFLVDGTLWDGVAAALAARGVRAIAPDWPLGSHRAPMASDADLTPRGIARIVAGFLAALELEDVTLVGNDTGGAICQFVLDTDASRVGRLVLTNCDAFEVFPPKPFDRMFQAYRHPALARPAMLPMRSRFLRHGPLGYGSLVAGELDAAQTRAWVEPYLSDAGIRRDVARFCRGVDPRELADVATRLDRFEGEVLLCWAPRDRFFRIELARRLQQQFARARLVEVPDARTFVPLDAPESLAGEIAALALATAT